MKAMFTTPCFIRKNTKELHDKLKKLGYNISHSAEHYPILYCFTDEDTHGVFLSCVSATTERKVNAFYKDFIDCGTNEQLFLALAALNENSTITKDEILLKYGKEN